MNVKINMNEKETGKIESYLAEVTKRLFDTEKALMATLVFCKARKEMLISSGKTHDYDQGRIDGAVEILKYASGEDDLEEIISIIMEQQKSASKVPVQGMDVV